jgi:hypothetical protein
MGKSKKLNEHHSVPSSRGGSDHPDNRVMLTETEHEAQHSIGPCNAMPHELMFTLLSKNRTVFRREFAETLMLLLASPHHEIYQPQVFNIRKETHELASSLLSHD